MGAGVGASTVTAWDAGSGTSAGTAGGHGALSAARCAAGAASARDLAVGWRRLSALARPARAQPACRDWRGAGSAARAQPARLGARLGSARPGLARPLPRLDRRGLDRLLHGLDRSSTRPLPRLAPRHRRHVERLGHDRRRHWASAGGPPPRRPAPRRPARLSGASPGVGPARCVSAGAGAASAGAFDPASVRTGRSGRAGDGQVFPKLPPGKVVTGLAPPAGLPVPHAPGAGPAGHATPQAAGRQVHHLARAPARPR